MVYSGSQKLKPLRILLTLDLFMHCDHFAASLFDFFGLLFTHFVFLTLPASPVSNPQILSGILDDFRFSSN